MSKEMSLPEVKKTAEGLRDALFDEINLLRSNKTTPNRARAISQLARDVIDSLRVQIQHQRLLVGQGKKGVFLGSPENKT
jgi:hypothetical protein